MPYVFLTPPSASLSTGSLDYIFLSKGWKVVDTLRLPTLAEARGPFPSDEQPSDHLMLAATLTPEAL